MLPFFLYFGAGILTLVHLLTLLLKGAPWNPLELLLLAGSAGLVVAAYLSLFKPYAAARLALVASLAAWCFYGPAIVNSARTRLHAQTIHDSDSTSPDLYRFQQSMKTARAQNQEKQDHHLNNIHA